VAVGRVQGAGNRRFRAAGLDMAGAAASTASGTAHDMPLANLPHACSRACAYTREIVADKVGFRLRFLHRAARMH